MENQENISKQLDGSILEPTVPAVPAVTAVTAVLAVTAVPAVPALKFTLLNECGRARRATVDLPHGRVETPVFMPVGTHGTVKTLTQEVLRELGPTIVLSNTYHIANRPGTRVLQSTGGLHSFMSWDRNILTDSGGFQMVSLSKLSTISEEGVKFQHPESGAEIMLSPEESVKVQNIIGSDIIMALDDVVPAVGTERERVELSVERTTRWIDRCIVAHQKKDTQNLFGIVQGGLHLDLRIKSIQQLVERDLPGYAIGGVSGGEQKSDFWKVVEICTRPDVGLPSNKPRYLMGVGYPLDIVVCVAMGVDMFDSVFPTRTARFGTALTSTGHIRVKQRQFENDTTKLDSECDCSTCLKFTKQDLHYLFPRRSLSNVLLTIHNIKYMFKLGEQIRSAISENKYSEFVNQFFLKQYPPHIVKQKLSDFENKLINLQQVNDFVPPFWTHDALKEVGIEIPHYPWDQIRTIFGDTAKCGLIPHQDTHIRSHKILR